MALSNPIISKRNDTSSNQKLVVDNAFANSMVICSNPTE